MVTISPTLQGKIERRARRAFRALDEGESLRFHRVTGISKTTLDYRVPRSGKKRISVVRIDGEILVDPPTTGLIEIFANADLKKLKNSTDKLHEGEVTAYLLVDKVKKVGKTYKKAEKLYSRDNLVGQVKRDQHIYVIDFAGDDIKDVRWDHVEASNYKVTAELDPEKDLGFTTGLIDLVTKDDVVTLHKKKHLGRVRAYKYVTKEAKSPTRTGKEAITYKVGEDYEIKDANTDPASGCHAGINLANVDWAKGYATGDNRLLAFEFDIEDVAAIPTSTDGKFRVHRCKCVEELDPKTLKPVKRAVESNTKPKKPKKAKKTKKKGFMDKLLGRGDDEK